MTGDGSGVAAVSGVAAATSTALTGARERRWPSEPESTRRDTEQARVAKHIVLTSPRSPPSARRGATSSLRLSNEPCIDSVVGCPAAHTRAERVNHCTEMLHEDFPVRPVDPHEVGDGVLSARSWRSGRSKPMATDFTSRSLLPNWIGGSSRPT